MQSPAEAGRWLQALGDEVEEVDVRARGWMLAADVDGGRRGRARGRRAPAARVRPLRRRRRRATRRPCSPPAARAEVYRPQGWLSPVLLVDGVIRGV